MYSVVMANCGPYPSIAIFTEANQKLSSGGEGRLTRVGELVGALVGRLAISEHEWLLRGSRRPSCAYNGTGAGVTHDRVQHGSHG